MKLWRPNTGPLRDMKEGVLLLVRDRNEAVLLLVVVVDNNAAVSRILGIFHAKCRGGRMRVLSNDVVLALEPDCGRAGPSVRIRREAAMQINVKDDPLPPSAAHVEYAYALVGIVHMQYAAYLVTVQHAEAIGCLFGHTVYRVQRLYRTMVDGEEQASDLVRWNAMRRIYESSSVYFSLGVDLSRHIQSRSEGASLGFDLDSMDDSFMWNAAMLDDFVHANAVTFVTPMVYGAVYLDDICCIIARKSRHHIGMRYLSRGCDEDGHAAHHVETEVLLHQDDNKVSSYIMSRSTIPLLWSQPRSLALQPPVQMGVPEQHRVVWDKHCSHLTRLYDASVLHLSLLDLSEGGLVKELGETASRTEHALVDFPIYQLSSQIGMRLQQQIGPRNSVVDLLEVALAKQPHPMCWMGRVCDGWIETIQRQPQVIHVVSKDAIDDIATVHHYLVSRALNSGAYKDILGCIEDDLAQLYVGSLSSCSGRWQWMLGLQRYIVNHFCDGFRHDMECLSLGKPLGKPQEKIPWQLVSPLWSFAAIVATVLLVCAVILGLGALTGGPPSIVTLCAVPLVALQGMLLFPGLYLNPSEVAAASGRPSKRRSSPFRRTQ